MSNRDMHKLIDRAEELGCRVERARHFKVYCPNGKLIVMSYSPSDHRAVLNARARLRRIGELPI